MYCEQDFVTEVCPHCGNENTVCWNVEKDGYVMYCPKCGERIMLCSECRYLDSGCDWTVEHGCKMEQNQPQM